MPSTQQPVRPSRPSSGRGSVQGRRVVPTKKQRRRGTTSIDRMLRPWWQSPWMLGGGGLAAVAVVIAIVVIVINVVSPAAVFTAQPVSASVLTAVTSPSQSALSQVGSGGSAVGINSGDPAGEIVKVKNTTTLTSGGKPEVIFVGAEYCPYCAAERWAIVTALSRFGTFSGLQEMVSSPSDVYPSTHTFTFKNATYSSSYIDFSSTELFSNVPDSNSGTGYAPLQTPSSQVSSIFSTYGASPYQNDGSGVVESYPFLDIANRFTIYSVQYSPQILQGLDWQQIASDLSNPQSQVAKAIIGSANYLTAAICVTTSNQPSGVCSSSAIQSLESTLSSETAVGS